MFLSLTRNPQGAPTGAVMRVYLDLQAGTGEVPRQGERLGEVSSIVVFCAGQGQQIFALAGCDRRGDFHAGEAGHPHVAPAPGVSTLRSLSPAALGSWYRLRWPYRRRLHRRRYLLMRLEHRRDRLLQEFLVRAPRQHKGILYLAARTGGR
jgi:hypothetical protein